MDGVLKPMTALDAAFQTIIALTVVFFAALGLLRRGRKSSTGCGQHCDCAKKPLNDKTSH
jgi:hypothetical protein